MHHPSQLFDFTFSDKCNIRLDLIRHTNSNKTRATRRSSPFHLWAVAWAKCCHIWHRIVDERWIARRPHVPNSLPILSLSPPRLSKAKRSAHAGIWIYRHSTFKTISLCSHPILFPEGLYLTSYPTYYHDDIHPHRARVFPTSRNPLQTSHAGFKCAACLESRKEIGVNVERALKEIEKIQ